MLTYQKDSKGGYPITNWDANELRSVANALANRIVADCKNARKDPLDGLIRPFTPSLYPQLTPEEANPPGNKVIAVYN